MALPPAAPARTLQHHRSIDIQVYARDDGLWEVDATVRDLRMRESMHSVRRRPPGTPIHDMLLRLVVDEGFNVIEAGSETRHMPYEGLCDELGDAYARLAGLNLMRGFRQAVKERLGGVLGCTHITELTQTLPTAVVQAFAGTVVDSRGEAASARQPFPIDRCHALRAEGEAVRLHYPRWHRAADAPTPQSHLPRETEP